MNPIRCTLACCAPTGWAEARTTRTIAMTATFLRMRAPRCVTFLPSSDLRDMTSSSCRGHAAPRVLDCRLSERERHSARDRALHRTHDTVDDANDRRHIASPRSFRLCAELWSIWFPRKNPYQSRCQPKTPGPPRVKIPCLQEVTCGLAVRRGLTWFPHNTLCVQSTSTGLLTPLAPLLRTWA